MLLSKDYFCIEDDVIRLDVNNNLIFFKHLKTDIQLSTLQCRFLFYLKNGVTRKNDLIEKIWVDKHRYINDNNYHQLIHQCRKLMAHNNIPPDIIRTVHRHGIILDLSVLSREATGQTLRSALLPGAPDSQEKRSKEEAMKIYSYFLDYILSLQK
ncbi:hypothetical protein BTJ39_17305 [Izhakiella australiensis]|uniref:OmpR/PhoB-type domain-containing protein n=1 Tax=Izhakiella australiensis TaxID=1926881 RepID=A0A1S8YIG2_9GAMM|nr:helix-turn-helix domain-containing protein [Izhakiella australiensis]OON38617.1 hypothetical protein BTJ39_17305 [Izhakiella australiensis]